MAVCRAIAGRRPDLHRDRAAADALGREPREQVGLPGSRTEPEDRGAADRPELVVEVELATRHGEEPAEAERSWTSCP